MTIHWQKSTCPYRGLGCGLMVGVEEGRVVRIRGMKDHSVNDGRICALAANLPPVFTAEGRLTQPLIRRDGRLVPAAWDEAITHVATGPRQIIQEHGPRRPFQTAGVQVQRGQPYQGCSCFSEDSS